MPRRRGFTSIDLIVVIVIVIVVGAVAFTAFMSRPRPRIHSRQIVNSSQVRGIHQSLVTYAQGNNGWFAGLDTHGNGNPPVEERLQILLNGNYFTPQYIMSPGETDPTITATTDGTVRPTNHSYALLQLNPGVTFEENKPISAGGPHARRKEWRDTINSDAPVIADRNTGTVAAPQSIWTTTPGDWRGSVAYNDNHVVFETTHVIPRTVYVGVETLNDHLFEAAPGSGDNDALFIHTGTGE